jgi:hypothetical protein
VALILLPALTLVAATGLVVFYRRISRDAPTGTGVSPLPTSTMTG